MSQVAYPGVVVDGLAVRLVLEADFEARWQLKDELQLLERDVCGGELGNAIALRAEPLVDANVDRVDVPHGIRQILHRVRHAVNLRLHFADGVGGADELVVVFVHQRLHLAVQAAHLQRQLVLLAQHLLKPSIRHHLLHVLLWLEALAVNVERIRVGALLGRLAQPVVQIEQAVAPAPVLLGLRRLRCRVSA